MAEQHENNILNFLRSLSEKNYAEANKYLQASLEDKMKSRIEAATQDTEI